MYNGNASAILKCYCQQRSIIKYANLSKPEGFFKFHLILAMKIMDGVKDGVKRVIGAARRMRARGAAEFAPRGIVAILAPHPDDEALGCGGLVARLCAASRAPHVVVMTGGGGALRGHSGRSEAEVVATRRSLSLKAAHELGLPRENLHFMDFVDGSVAHRPLDQMERLRTLLAVIKPETLLVPHWGEGWPDHLAVRSIGLELADCLNIGHVMEYCVWMWYYNVRGLRWNKARSLQLTSSEREAKHRAVDAYVRPVSPEGVPWSGVLPPAFLHAHRTSIELYFER